jgi:hypothetical protein
MKYSSLLLSTVTLLYSLAAAQHLVTVVHHEIVTVTWDAAARAAEQGSAGASGAVAAGKKVSGQEYNETGSFDDEADFEDSIDSIDGKVNAKQTRTKSFDPTALSKSRTASSTGASDGNSAASLKASVGVAGAIALMAVAGGALL